MYLNFETRHLHALWEATHAVNLPIEQRDLDPDLAQFYKQRK